MPSKHSSALSLGPVGKRVSSISCSLGLHTWACPPHPHPGPGSTEHLFAQQSAHPEMAAHPGRGLRLHGTGVPVPSPRLLSSGPWRKDVERCRVPPWWWCLKMAEESSSRLQPSRYAAFWAHSWRANCLRPAMK